ncbi:hypothetical protein [Curtobacterium sp. MCBD17_030]|uniref:hypothetical protein n=1 Tax=Curtobacterium sp. MCBD17_030 TaxID=2175649 RepID=UPI000D9F552F|nr:hypothetical protein [Curtobacterium sp. MCBD17_030]PYY32083.1 hypothetical protein DEI89_14320 [Curtobacterium sp. MCBD17_030]
MIPVAAGPTGEPVTVTTPTVARGALPRPSHGPSLRCAALPVLAGAIAAGVALVRLSAAVCDVLQDEGAALVT